MQTHFMDVGDIEGIGSVFVKRLNKAKVFSIADLIEISVVDLEKKLKGSATQNRIEQWKQMAVLLNIELMTPNWAEALVKADVGNHERMMSISLKDLKAVFAKALKSGISQTVPTVSEIADMKVDAAALFHTGTYCGHVMNEKGKAVGNAEIQIHNVKTETNERGQFRLTRVALGQTLKAIIRHPQMETKVIHPVTLAVGQDTRIQHRIQLLTKVLSTDADPPSLNSINPNSMMSELNGDFLPDVSGFPIRTLRGKLEDIPKDDILMVRKVMANGQWDLVSRFRSYEDGTFIVHAYKVDVGDLPGNVKLRGHVTHKNGRLKSIKVSKDTIVKQQSKARVVRIKAENNFTLDGAGFNAFLKAYHNA